MLVVYAKNSSCYLQKKFSIRNMECSVRITNTKEIQKSIACFRSEVYEETNTIWFSDFYDKEEEPMYKLIGVRDRKAENSKEDFILSTLSFSRPSARWLYII